MYTLRFSGGSGGRGSSIILNIGFFATTSCKTSCCLMLLLPILEWGVGGDIVCLVPASCISFHTISHISSLIFFFMSSNGWWKYEFDLTKRSWPTTRPRWSSLPNAWHNMSFGPGGGSPVSLPFLVIHPTTKHILVIIWWRWLTYQSKTTNSRGPIQGSYKMNCFNKNDNR